MTIESLTGSGADQPHRAVWPAVRRGLQGRCPACGEGPLFDGYLRIADRCAACGEELHHHRADDLPPYIVITIVGHIIVTLVLAVEMLADYSTLTQMIVWPLLTLALSLALMRPVKGAVVGYQWALRMHGFDGARRDESAHER
ncbi:MAG: DUF983 domain-containing protein [Pseudochelatococcus sp.]|jgi:uncharacterized protein (DUF983 family)|uniref:DUF983 domain-containing protein n=1 Tax=Pseudochelatococcus sp. TaxID=2020869 RepID=UPI003D9405AA